MEKSEDLTAKLQKLKGDGEFLDERTKDCDNERKRLNEQFLMLKNSIQ